MKVFLTFFIHGVVVALHDAKPKKAKPKARHAHEDEPTEIPLKALEDAKGMAGIGCLYHWMPRPTFPNMDIRTYDKVRLEGNPKIQPTINRKEWQTQPHWKCATRALPTKMHTIWVGSPMPDKYVKNTRNFAEMNPAWTVIVWLDHPQGAQEKFPGNVEVRDLKDYYDEFLTMDVVNKLQLKAGKSNQLRMEVVYLEGGIYQDTDAMPLQSFDKFGQVLRWPFVVFDETYQNLANGVFGFEQRAPFLEYALRLSQEECMKFNNCNPMAGCPSPSCLTRAVLNWHDPYMNFIHQKHIIHSDNKAALSVTHHSMNATWMEDYKNGITAKYKKQHFR
eukprot:gene360-552_t